MSNIVPFSDIENMGLVAAKSKLFGFKTPEEAMAIMLLCQAENLHPATAMRDYHIIQGRPALKADAMLARFQQSGGSVKWEVYTNEEVSGTFSHPQGGSLRVSWTLAQAKQIGIANKDNWRNYPRAMLRARVISEGIRSVYPGAVVGVYTPEEVQDFEPPRSATPVDMGAVQRVEDAIEASPIQQESQEDDGAFALYVPNSDQPYARFHSPDEWIKGYAELVSRIMSSPKLTDFEKTDKLFNLSQVNKTVTEGFDSFSKIKLKGEIVKAGGSVDPKQDLSPSPADSELKEIEF
jgi:hypothetical protein